MELHRLCRKFKFARFFLSKSARFEAAIVIMRIFLKKSLAIN